MRSVQTATVTEMGLVVAGVVSEAARILAQSNLTGYKQESNLTIRGIQIQFMSTEPNKVIYSMVGVSKYYDKKPVLKDIYLSYFYGAKIGVGLNGSGKSSLLRILAGADKEINGETVISPGFTIGYLEQEPLIDDSCYCWFCFCCSGCLTAM